MLSLPSARQGWEKTNGTMKGVLQKSGWLSCEAYLSRGHLAHRNEAPDRLWWCVQVKGELRRIRVGQDLFWIFVVENWGWITQRRLVADRMEDRSLLRQLMHTYEIKQPRSEKSRFTRNSTSRDIRRQLVTDNPKGPGPTKEKAETGQRACRHRWPRERWQKRMEKGHGHGCWVSPPPFP